MIFRRGLPLLGVKVSAVRADTWVCPYAPENCPSQWNPPAEPHYCWHWLWISSYTGPMLLNGCTTSGIFCRPDCPPGRRTKPEHRVHFPDSEAAFSAGYRPCLVCKPLAGPPGPWQPKKAR
ncbi:MAG: Ada metal-binding domain-containing protein [Dehalococcoidia bacterium]